MADFFACTSAHLEAYEAAREARAKHDVTVYNYSSLDQGRGQTPEEVEEEIFREHQRTVAESLARLQEAQAQLRADRAKLDEVAATQGALETAADAVEAALDLDAQTRPPRGGRAGHADVGLGSVGAVPQATLCGFFRRQPAAQAGPAGFAARLPVGVAQAGL